MEMTRQELLRATLGAHFLLERGSRLDVLCGLCGLQAQFAANPAYALRIRAHDFDAQTWGAGLVKVWTLRGTIHVVRADELGLHLSARDRGGPWRENRWWDIPVEIKPRWADFICACVADGIDGRDELKEACRGAGMDEELLGRVFNGWGGLLKDMSDRGMIAYRPGIEKRFMLPPPVEWMGREEARLEVMRRYFAHFGPATPQDFAAFTGWGLTEVRTLLRRGGLPLREVSCEGASYLCLGEPAPELARGLPRCVFLAGFDQLVLGYKDRSRFMDAADARLVTNAAGIVFPTVMLRGRLRARWKKEAGRVVVTPFRPLSATDQQAVAARARRLFSDERGLQVVFLPPLRA